MARRICERRKQLRLTQEELAEMSDMTTQAVSYAESGKRAMRPDSLRKLAAALCVSADYLLTGDIVDKDLLILADKLRQLTPSQIHTIESIIDECIQLYSEQFIVLRFSNIFFSVDGSKLLVASSKTKTCGFFSRALAIANRCL